MRALHLLLPDGLAASAVADTLATEIPIVSHKAHTVQRVFWDTFDGRLHGGGLALVEAAGRLALADLRTGAERAGAMHRRGARHLLVADLAAGPLRDELAGVIEMRALTPIARVRSRQLPLNVLDEVGKIVVRMRVEEPAAIVDDTRVPLPPRLHLDGVRGYDREFDELRALLDATLGLREAPRAVQDDAVECQGGFVGGCSSKLRIELGETDRADVAAAAILRRLLEIIELNLPGTLAGTDSEFLHDLRVAVRRTRALQRELRGVFAEEPLRVFRAHFKELQRITGPTRDLDVQLLEFDELAAGLPGGAAGDVAPLRRLLEDRLVVERRSMERALRSDATRAVLDGWSTLIEELGRSASASGPDACRPVAELATERVSTVYRQMVKAGSQIGEDSPAEALHDLRKQGKELRYLLEFFATLFPDCVVKPMVSSLKGLQDVLGTFQDREVQADLLRSLGDEIAWLEGGPAALMAMGVLAERLVAEQAQARERFAERFGAFAAKAQRKLVAQTFG
ncbi:MAG: CHAD domain-containing protein [Solirubrobacteraceae bacterium]